MRPTGRRSILQVHPTRRCNLRCRHCYADSGPQERDTLPRELFLDLIEDAAELGYDTLSLSGGEPLMYRPLPAVLRAAHRLGMQTLVTTNGTLFTPAGLAALAAHLDFLAISIDGPEGDHDRMRAHTGAFAALRAGLPIVRDAGVRFGLLFTLTQHNVHQVEWAVEFALDAGAELLQVHPLQPVGRGAALSESMPDAVERRYAVLEVMRLQATVGHRLDIHLDVAPGPALSDTAPPQRHSRQRLGDLLTPLVVEPDGRCVPLEYGFDARFELGNLYRQRLAQLAAPWLVDVLPTLTDLCRRAERDAATSAQTDNWYDLVRREIRESLGVAP